MLKIMENLWAVGAPPRNPLGSSQRSPDPVADGDGLLLPPQEPHHPRSQPSALRLWPPVNDPGHALGPSRLQVIFGPIYHILFDPKVAPTFCHWSESGWRLCHARRSGPVSPCLSCRTQMKATQVRREICARWRRLM